MSSERKETGPHDPTKAGDAVPIRNNDEEDDLLLLVAGFALFPLLCRRPGSSR
jgi:hypothetical protein